MLYATGHEAVLLAARTAHDARIEDARAAVATARAEEGSSACSGPTPTSSLRSPEPGKGVRKRLAEAKAEVARLRNELDQR